MKFTLSWLKMHLDTDASLEAVAEKLTMIGLEVEKIEDRAKLLAPFTVARVLSAEKHPNADKLKVCMVETGEGAPVQVVCGAPNARAGMMAVFARPGAHIPGSGMELKVAAVRGVESRGMLVSGREMGISEDHQGIIELPADAPLGKPFAALMGLDDPVLDVAIPTSRPDCHGIDGIARDLAAAGLGTFKSKAPAPVAGKFPCPVQVKLEFGATPSLCPAFRAAAHSRREEPPLARLGAAQAARHRAAPDQCARRYHQLAHLRPRRGRCTCSTRRRSRAISRCGAPRRARS